MFRSLLATGLRVYGKEIVKEEFFLRRMTNLSLSLFWLIASVWEVKRNHREGAYPPEELDIVAYLTEEARELQRRDGRAEKSRREKIHDRIVRSL